MKLYEFYTATMKYAAVYCKYPKVDLNDLIEDSNTIWKDYLKKNNLAEYETRKMMDIDISEEDAELCRQMENLTEAIDYLKHHAK